MNECEITAARISDAIETGLEKLKAKLEDVNVEILSEGGFFRKAKVRLSLINKKNINIDTIEQKKIKDIQYVQNKNIASSDNNKQANIANKNSEKSNQDKFQLNIQNKNQNNIKIDVDNWHKKDIDNSANNKQPSIVVDNNSMKKSEKSNQDKSKLDTQNTKQDKIDIDDKILKNKDNNITKDINTKIDKKVLEYVDTSRGESINTPVGDFVQGIIDKMGVKGKVLSYMFGQKDIDLIIDCDDNAVIGHRGDTLNSIETIAMQFANGGDEQRIKVKIDSQSYRKRRFEQLVKLAGNVAEKAIRTNKKVSLEPMNDVERKIIHSALQTNDKVFTKSEGHGENRYIVVYVKR